MGKPAKVLHVLSGASGGTAHSAIALMEALAKDGIESCAVSHGEGVEPLLSRLATVTRGEVLFTSLYFWNKRVRAPLWKRPLIELRQIAKTGWGRGSGAAVAWFARQHGADLIHTGNSTMVEGGLAARALGLPHVWHVRELIGPGMPFRLPVEGEALGELMARRASKVVANSEATARQLAPWLPAELLEVVPNGIDLGGFTPRVIDLSARPLVVAMVASLDSRVKKHGLFIEAARLLDRALPIELRIYGDDPSRGGVVSGGPYVDELRERVARYGLGLGFMGHVPDPRQIMREIDVLVQPSDLDSFGRVVVEAMAAKLPVAATDGGGAHEIVVHEGTGLLTPPDDAAALARSIERLVRDAELRARLGAAGRARAEREYSLEAHVRRIVGVYEAAMARPVRRALGRALGRASHRA